MARDWPRLAFGLEMRTMLLCTSSMSFWINSAVWGIRWTSSTTCSDIRLVISRRSLKVARTMRSSLPREKSLVDVS